MAQFDLPRGRSWTAGASAESFSTSSRWVRNERYRELKQLEQEAKKSTKEMKLLEMEIRDESAGLEKLIKRDAQRVAKISDLSRALEAEKKGENETEANGEDVVEQASEELEEQLRRLKQEHADVQSMMAETKRALEHKRMELDRLAGQHKELCGQIARDEKALQAAEMEESFQQSVAVQHEMRSLTEDLGRLGRLMEGLSPKSLPNQLPKQNPVRQQKLRAPHEVTNKVTRSVAGTTRQEGVSVPEHRRFTSLGHGLPSSFRNKEPAEYEEREGSNRKRHKNSSFEQELERLSEQRDKLENEAHEKQMLFESVARFSSQLRDTESSGKGSATSRPILSPSSVFEGFKDTATLGPARPASAETSSASSDVSSEDTIVENPEEGIASSVAKRLNFGHTSSSKTDSQPMLEPVGTDRSCISMEDVCKSDDDIRKDQFDGVVVEDGSVGSCSDDVTSVGPYPVLAALTTGSETDEECSADRGETGDSPKECSADRRETEDSPKEECSADRGEAEESRKEECSADRGEAEDSPKEEFSAERSKIEYSPQLVSDIEAVGEEDLTTGSGISEIDRLEDEVGSWEDGGTPEILPNEEFEANEHHAPGSDVPCEWESLSATCNKVRQSLEAMIDSENDDGEEEASTSSLQTVAPPPQQQSDIVETEEGCTPQTAQNEDGSQAREPSATKDDVDENKIWRSNAESQIRELSSQLSLLHQKVELEVKLQDEMKEQEHLEQSSAATEKLSKQVSCFGDEINELKQSILQMQQNLLKEVENRSTAEHSVDQFRIICTDQSAKLEHLETQVSHLVTELEEQLKLRAELEGKLDKEAQERLKVEAQLKDLSQAFALTASTREKGEEAVGELVEQQKILLVDQLREAEKLRTVAEVRVFTLDKQVEQLEMVYDVAQNMQEVLKVQDKALKFGLQTLFQLLMLALGVATLYSRVAEAIRGSLIPT